MSAVITMTIPFPGFYETNLAAELDDVEEREAESIVELNESHGLDAREVCDALYFTCSYGIAFEYVAKAYAEAFAELVNAEAKPPFALVYEKMDSPKEYNFTTDRVYMTLPLEDFRRMYAVTDRDILANVIRKSFTSRDGFISYYSNDAADWHEKPLEEWDHNEAGTLLRAYLLTHVDDIDEDTENTVEHRIYEELAGNETFYSAFNACLDWDKLQERLKDKAEAQKEPQS